jgi:hypothetical protein
MPGSWNPHVYREREKRWRDAASELPPGPTRDVYLVIADGYAKLAKLIARDAAIPAFYWFNTCVASIRTPLSFFGSRRSAFKIVGAIWVV